MARNLIIFCLFLSILRRHETAKIFAWFASPSISHHYVFRELTNELVRRGHDLTILTTDPVYTKEQRPPNLIEIDVHNISYDIWKRSLKSHQGFMTNDFYIQTLTVLRVSTEVIDAQLSTKEMKTIIQGTEKYDLLILEACTPQTLGMSHVYKVPVILASSFGNLPGQLEDFGAPFHPFLYPSTYQKNNFNLTLWGKIKKLQELWQITKSYYAVGPFVRNIMTKHFGADVPYISELKKNADLVFINELWRENRPVPPGVVYIGGIYRRPRRDLPEDLKSFLDSSKYGVIYMSFGTNVDPTLHSAETIQVFTNVFSKLPYDVLWKWDGDELPGRSHNIRISKWWPQSDLLHHPKVKLFITQSGLQSVEEAISAGVPMIGIPQILDQWYNAESSVRHGIGLQLDIRTIDETQLKEAIDTIIGDSSYRTNIRKLHDQINDRPMPSLELAVWWTEYVLRHKGAKHLRSPSALMPFTEYYELELVFTILAITIAVIVSIMLVLCYLMKLLKKSFVGHQKVKKA